MTLEAIEYGPQSCRLVVGLWDDMGARSANMPFSPNLLVLLEHLSKGQNTISVEWHFHFTQSLHDGIYAWVDADPMEKIPQMPMSVTLVVK